MILDFHVFCDSHRRIDSVVFILAALDFSNEGRGFQKFDFFDCDNISTFCLKMVIFIM